MFVTWMIITTLAVYMLWRWMDSRIDADDAVLSARCDQEAFESLGIDSVLDLTAPENARRNREEVRTGFAGVTCESAV